MNEKRQETIHKINAEIESVCKLTEAKFEEIIGITRRAELRNILKRLKELKDKLERNTFEVSIIGLEKSGKSTFANAFMGGIDILPTKDARCTYTATKICFGEKDSADVEFYSEEEFRAEFFNKLSLLNMDLTDLPENWTEWTPGTIQALNNDDTPFSSDQKNILRDIEEIIQNRFSILGLIGKGEQHFNEDELETEIRGYIECPSKALAVKRITIYSNQIEKNAVIYDVPGFDSPTRLHKDQTREWMKRSDAIILIVNADRPSFNDSLVDFFATIDKDDDGISISEKMFVFANRADIATTLTDNMQKIRDELLHYDIISDAFVDTRLLAGSAKVKLDIEKNGDYTGEESLHKKGLETGNGIEEIRSRLNNYNDTIRLSVLNRRITIQRQKLTKIFDEIMGENAVQDQGTLERELKKKADVLRLESRDRIIKELSKYNEQVKKVSRQDKPITTKMQKCISALFSNDRYTITADELQEAKYKENTDSETILTAEYNVRGMKYKSMYDEFLDNIVNLAVEEYIDSENALLKAFEKGLGLTPAHPCFDTLEEAIKAYITSHCRNSAPEGYYSSLVRRYSGNLFLLLIRQPFSEESRFTVFDNERRNFYSLSLFGANNEISIRPDTQPMHAQVLYHQLLNESDAPTEKEILTQQLVLITENKLHEPVAVSSELYTMLTELAREQQADAVSILQGLLDSLTPYSSEETGIPLFAITPNPMKKELIQKLSDRNTYANASNSATSIVSEDYYRNFFNGYKKTHHKDSAAIIEEFRTDVQILTSILNNQVMRAIDIEVPFLDLVEQNVTTLKASLQDITFIDFIRDHEDKILKEEYDRLRAENEIKQKRAEIINEIKAIIDQKGEEICQI